MQGISWIASYPKSGNTWLRMFLAAYRNGGNPVYPNALPSDMESADVSDEHYFAVSPLPLERLAREQALQLRGAALLHIMAQAYVRPLFVKTHWRRCNFENVEAFPPALSAKSIYIVRDPRDVAISFAKWMKKDLDETISNMGDTRTKLDGVNYKALFSYLGTWSEHVESWVGREDTIVLRYEDMLERPAETFAGALWHIGIPIDENRIERAVAASSFESLQAMEDAGRFIETPDGIDRFFRQGTAGQWRGVLTDEQVAKIEADHGETMKRMGYLDGSVRRAA